MSPETIVIIVAISLLTLLVLVLIVLFIVFVLNFKKHQTPVAVDNTNTMKEIGVLQHSIGEINDKTQNAIKLEMSNSLNSFNLQNNDRLDKFQNNLVNNILTKFDNLNEKVDQKLNEINKKVDDKLQEGFKNTNESMTQVRERLQAIDDAQKNIENLSKDVISLKTVLEGNQTRGQYGEYQLSMVLNQVFGDTINCYKEQYTIKHSKDGNDVRADAVVFVPEPNKMICIDSKFPFAQYSKIINNEVNENPEKALRDFASDVRKHITAIKDKYIIEGKTAPEAIMFIPNDGVFAFIHHNLQDVVEHAREKRVVLTSPSTLPSILVTISMVRIEAERAKNAREVSKQLAKLGMDFKGFAREWETFSTQLERATRSRETLDHRVGKINGKFEAIKTNGQLEEIEMIDENNEN